MAFIPQTRSVEIVQAAPDQLVVNGALTFETARQAFERGLRAIEGAPSGATVQVDCAGVTESDSAGLAVLIDWLANATRLGRSVRFLNLPAGISASAKISDVEEILLGGAAAAA